MSFTDGESGEIESIIENYNVFISSIVFGETAGETGVLVPAPVSLVPCAESKHAAVIYATISNILGQFENPYCPESSVLNLSGVYGSSLWIIPDLVDGRSLSDEVY
jgi:hypothetical protein